MFAQHSQARSGIHGLELVFSGPCGSHPTQDILCFFPSALSRSKDYSALPAKRLWHFLVKQELLQETFIRYIFTKKRKQSEVIKGCNFLLKRKLNFNCSSVSSEFNFSSHFSLTFQFLSFNSVWIFFQNQHDCHVVDWDINWIKYFRQDISHLYVFEYCPNKQNIYNNSNKQRNLNYIFWCVILNKKFKCAIHCVYVYMHE